MTSQRGRTDWAGQSGKGTLRNFITLTLVVAAVYAGVKFLPVRAAAFQLDDAIREQVVFAGSRRRRMGDEEVRRNILERAEDLRLPLGERDVEIRRTRIDITISVKYTVRIEFPLDMHYDWSFESTHQGPSF
jgi:hypothetical protein